MDSLNNPLRYGEGLIGRIDQLQSELLEQARIIGKSAEREERLLARVEELERALRGAQAWIETAIECDLDEPIADNGMTVLDGLKNEAPRVLASLRQALADMEQADAEQ